MSEQEFQAEVLKRLDAIDGRLDGMDGRLDSIETALAKKADKVDVDAVDNRLSEVLQELRDQNLLDPGHEATG